MNKWPTAARMIQPIMLPLLLDYSPFLGNHPWYHASSGCFAGILWLLGPSRCSFHLESVILLLFFEDA